MKISIVTVFKSENCGSFLQAWALKEQLSSNDNSVYFCDYKNAANRNTAKMCNMIKCCLRLRFKRALNILEKTRSFRKLQKKFKTASNQEDSDVYFFGSDTLWNFEDGFFGQNIPFFTGATLNKPCYTYSVSVDSTSKEKFLNQTDAIKNIQKFKKIAVRDSYSEELVSAVYPCENIVRTIDPTLLLDKEIYIKHFLSESLNYKKSLVIYYFGVIKESVWKELEAFARKRDLRIINIGLHGDRDAETVVASPVNFISAFSDAEYIFTNTFHGCVFSTIFNKPFATAGIHKKKIEEFLEEFSLSDRVVSCPDDVEKVFTTAINYEKVNELTKEKRARSIEYLESCIREVKNNE